MAGGFAGALGLSGWWLKWQVEVGRDHSWEIAIVCIPARLSSGPLRRMILGEEEEEYEEVPGQQVPGEGSLRELLSDGSVVVFCWLCEIPREN